MNRKVGRPTENPKHYRESFRMSKDDVDKLNYCIKKTEMTKTEIVRKGIDIVYNKIRATDALDK